MKRQSRARDIVGLLIATAFFGYCGVHVLIKQTESPSLGHYVGACLIPGVFLILLIREVLAVRSERQHTLEAKTTGEVPNHTSEGIRRPADGPPKPSM